MYNGTKAFLDSFAFALRHELKNSGVTVTDVMIGCTAMLEAVNSLVFELGLWQSWTSLGKRKRHDIESDAEITS